MSKKKTKKNILFLAATHGNESFSIPILKRLKREYPDKFSWIISNKKALSKKVRYIDADLNRVAPGNMKSKQYERRRAAEIIKLSKAYKYIIDIHGTVAQTGIFTIVIKDNTDNLKLAAALPIRNVVIWASAPSGPLSRSMNKCVEIECGPKNSKKIKQSLLRILKRIIKRGIKISPQQQFRKRLFRVYGKLNRKDISPNDTKKLNEFRKVKINNEKFYPLLIGRYKDIVCFKMELLKK